MELLSTLDQHQDEAALAERSSLVLVLVEVDEVGDVDVFGKQVRGSFRALFQCLLIIVSGVIVRQRLRIGFFVHDGAQAIPVVIEGEGRGTICNQNRD